MNPEALTKKQRNERTRKVAKAILNYSPGEGAREAFIDLLTDALHLYGEEQVRCHLDWALQHYHAETSDEVLAS
jgi:hypothetical protein